MQGGIWCIQVSGNDCFPFQTDLSRNFLTYDAWDADVTRWLESLWTRKVYCENINVINLFIEDK